MWTSTLSRTHWPLTWRPDGSVDLYFDRPDPRLLGLIPLSRPVPLTVALMDKGQRYQVRVTSWRTESPGEFIGWATIPGTSLGVHVHHRVITRDLREVAVQISNACVSSAPFKGGVYFDAWSVSFEGDWHVGGVKSWSGDASFFPAMASLTMRFGLDRANSYYPWPAPTEIPAFGPSRTRVPVTPIADPTEYHWYGPWELAGDPKSYAHGGTDIYCFPRFYSIRGQRRAADGTAARQRAIAYDAATGDAYPAARWGAWEYIQARGTVHNQRVPYFSGGTVNDQWTERKLNAGTCEYEASIQTRRDEQGFAAYDDAHGVRAALNDLALWYTTRDLISWYRLQALAQDTMTADRMVPIGPETPSYQGEYIPHSMHQKLTAAKANPHRGGGILRREAWKRWIVAQVSWITPPGPTKDYMLAWLRMNLELRATVMPPNGIPYNGGYKWSDDGLPWEPVQNEGGGFLPSWSDAPSWQIPFETASYDEASRALGILPRDLHKSVDGYLMGSCVLVPSKYNPASRGVPYYLRTAVDGKFDAPITQGGGLSNPQYFRDSLARAYATTGDPLYLERACQIDFPQPNVDALRDAVRNSNDPWLWTTRSVLE